MKNITTIDELELTRRQKKEKFVRYLVFTCTGYNFKLLMCIASYGIKRTLKKNVEKKKFYNSSHCVVGRTPDMLITYRLRKIGL